MKVSSVPSTSSLRLGHRESRSSGGLRIVAVLLAGGYSWALTVLPPALAAGADSLVAISAWAALLSLFAAPLLPRGQIALTFAIDVFLSLCVLSWFAGRDLASDPPFGVFGSLGWLAYTLALGSLSTPSGRLPKGGPNRWEPRSPPRVLPVVALGLCVVGVVLLLATAWRVERPEVGVLAHMVALGTALLLLRGGAHLSGYLQSRGTRLDRVLGWKGARLSLTVTVLLCALGLWWNAR